MSVLPDTYIGKCCICFSPPSPVLGLGIVKDELLGSTMLTLTSDFEFQRLRLR